MGKRHTMLDLIRSIPSGGFCVCRDGFIVSLDRDIIDHEGNGRESLPDLHFMTSLRFGAFKLDLRRRVEEGSLDLDTPVSQETWRLFSDMLASASQRHVGNPFAQLALFLPCSLAASLFWGCVLDTFFTVSGRVKVWPDSTWGASSALWSFSWPAMRFTIAVRLVRGLVNSHGSVPGRCGES